MFLIKFAIENIYIIGTAARSITKHVVYRQVLGLEKLYASKLCLNKIYLVSGYVLKSLVGRNVSNLGLTTMSFRFLVRLMAAIRNLLNTSSIFLNTSLYIVMAKKNRQVLFWRGFRLIKIKIVSDDKWNFVFVYF